MCDIALESHTLRPPVSCCARARRSLPQCPVSLCLIACLAQPILLELIQRPSLYSLRCRHHVSYLVERGHVIAAIGLLASSSDNLLHLRF